MPLVHSSSDAALKSNISTLMGEVGKSPHVKSRAQALAIAYATKRRGRASGGAAPWFVRNEARSMMHSGPINSVVPGRTDKHNMAVPSGSYVIPSETVSHLGENNTNAGMAVLNNMFGKTGPYGSAIMRRAARKLIARGRGGWAGWTYMTPGGAAYDAGDGTPVDIVTAGGEYVVPPHVVEAVGDGDVDRGHKILDAWVMRMRKDHIKTLKSLPPPAKK